MRIKSNSGFTLVEVVMVIIIMAIIAAVAMRSLDSGLETTRIEETRKEMNQLAEAIAGNPNLYSNGMRTNFGYVGDIGALPPSLDALVTNPGYGTWRGPYIASDYTNYADDFKKDSWGQLYAYTGSISIASMGGSDTLTRAIAQASTDLTANSVAGSITDAAGNPPGDSAINVRVILSYPNGSGGTKDSTVVPNSGGGFSFPSCVPIGNHQLRAINTTTADTVVSYVSVYPKSSVQASLRLPGAIWAASGGGGGGGGGGSAEIVYVAGTAQAYGSQDSRVRFDVQNIGTEIATVNSIKLTYSFTGFYDRVSWDGTQVINSSNPWPGNNNIVSFNQTKYLGAGEQITVDINYFRAGASGGSRVDMNGNSFTVTFSNGSVLTVDVP